MAYKEDSDIKIFDGSHAEHDEEFLRQIEALDHHRHNGNVQKARQLGRNLYELVKEDAGREKDVDPDFKEGKMPVKAGVLAMFTAEAALNMYLPSTQLSTIAIAELHRLLAKINSPVYEKILESPAYSFYYLCLRKGGDDAIEEIGRAFSEHCRHEGEEKYVQYGRYIYEVVTKEVQKQIDLMDFAD